MEQPISKFDIVLFGGRIIDPANGRNEIADIGIRNGRITSIAKSIPIDSDAERIDVRGNIVVPGLIDTHAHIFQHVTGRFGLNPDLVGINSGVPFLVDQGGPSCITIPAFRKFIAEPSESGVYAFLSAYVVGGLEGHYYADLYSPSGVDVDATVNLAVENKDIVRGIKAHAEIGGYARWGKEVVSLAKEISRQAEIPLYIHLGQLWPLPDGSDQSPDADEVLAFVADLAEPGDILAHPFTRHPGGFVNQDGQVHPVLKDLMNLGIKVDVGHGSHFSFEMARMVLGAGIIPNTLGADMHGYNTFVPGGRTDDTTDDHLFGGQVKFSLCSAMTELLALGLSLEEIIPMVTSNAAEMLGLTAEIGSMSVGDMANISVLEKENGRWRLSDNTGVTVETDQLLRPKFCIRKGCVHMADAPILPTAEVSSGVK